MTDEEKKTPAHSILPLRILLPLFSLRSPLTIFVGVFVPSLSSLQRLIYSSDLRFAEPTSGNTKANTSVTLKKKINERQMLSERFQSDEIRVELKFDLFICSRSPRLIANRTRNRRRVLNTNTRATRTVSRIVTIDS